MSSAATLSHPRPGNRVPGLALALAGLLLAACASQVDPALLPDTIVLGTATVTGCTGYGTRPHWRSPTPTGTGTPPTLTPTATPTRPDTCDFCTMRPRATRTPISWPGPIRTCTAAPDEATSTAAPTEESPRFPTVPVPTALAPALGVINPLELPVLEGEAHPGGVATDPFGRPVLIWSQLNPDPGQETAGHVYVALTDVTTGQWLPARSINAEPGIYKIGKSAPEAAIGVAPDGTLYAVYVRSTGQQAALAARTSTDRGASWSAPLTLPYASSNDELYNVRLVVDAAGQPHVVGLIVQAGCDSAKPCGDLVYYERRPDGSWRAAYRPVTAGAGRQYSVAVATLPLADGRIRTILAWDEGDTAIYSSYKDGGAGGWSRPVLISTNHPPIVDYEPGFGGSLQVATCNDGTTTWAWAGWSGYSTGYLAGTWSPDGGATWLPEDLFAYLPHDVSGPVGGTIHPPTAYWSPAHHRLLVISAYCLAGQCFPVLAYGAPGEPGRTWAGYVGPQNPPIRAFGPTGWETATDLRGPLGYGGAPRYTVLFWRENAGTPVLHLARLDLDTLLSGTEAPR